MSDPAHYKSILIKDLFLGVWS